MIDKIDTADLDVLIKNHSENLTSAFLTNSVVIELVHLEEFINKARRAHGAAFDAIKIHLIRYELTQDQDHIKKIPNKDLTQVSLALVPANITDRVEWKAEDLKKNNQKFTLLVCKPTGATRSEDDKTGVCPPKCPGT